MDAVVRAGHRAVAFDHYCHGASQGTDANLPLFNRAVDAVLQDLARSGESVVGGVGHSLGAAALLHAHEWDAQRLYLVAPLIDPVPLLTRRMCESGIHRSICDRVIDQVSEEYDFDIVASMLSVCCLRSASRMCASCTAVTIPPCHSVAVSNY